MTTHETRICPKCGQPYIERPALSREDGRTEICPHCGMVEAVEAMAKHCGWKDVTITEATTPDGKTMFTIEAPDTDEQSGITVNLIDPIE